MLGARWRPVIMTFGCRALWLLETWSSRGASTFLPRRLPSSPDFSSRFLPSLPGFFVPAVFLRKLLVSCSASMTHSSPLLAPAALQGLMQLPGIILKSPCLTVTFFSSPLTKKPILSSLRRLCLLAGLTFAWASIPGMVLLPLYPSVSRGPPSLPWAVVAESSQGPFAPGPPPPVGTLDAPQGLV